MNFARSVLRLFLLSYKLIFQMKTSVYDAARHVYCIPPARLLIYRPFGTRASDTLPGPLVGVVGLIQLLKTTSHDRTIFIFSNNISTKLGIHCLWCIVMVIFQKIHKMALIVAKSLTRSQSENSFEVKQVHNTGITVLYESKKPLEPVVESV